MDQPEHGAASAAAAALHIIRKMQERLSGPSDDLERLEENLTFLSDYLSIERGSKPWTVALAVGLTAHEAAIFDVLFKRGQHGATKALLYENLYGNDRNGGPKDKIIEVMVSKVRRKLVDLNAPLFIETLWGRGYRIVEDRDGSLVREFYGRQKGGRNAKANAEARQAWLKGHGLAA